MENEFNHIVGVPEQNIDIGWGDGTITFHFHAKKTIRNRIKFWLLCQFFPYHIKRWD